jgi:DNA-directed RNA polymerase specialized sigma24 family protein
MDAADLDCSGVESAQLRRLLCVALDRLSAKERIVIEMIFFEGVPSFAEAGRRLGVTSTHARYLYFEGLRKLRRESVARLVADWLSPSTLRCFNASWPDAAP